MVPAAMHRAFCVVVEALTLVGDLQPACLLQPATSVQCKALTLNKLRTCIGPILP